MSTPASPSWQAKPPTPAIRPEVLHTLQPLPHVQAVRSLSGGQRIWAHPAWRQAVILLTLAALWEGVARWQDNDLLLPTFTATLQALWAGLSSGELLIKTGLSLSMLLEGYALGVLGALAFTALATSSRWGRDLLSTLTAMLNPLPAIALLPLALLWFGLGKGSLLFVLVHSVLWPVALNTLSGFQSVPENLRMAGRNYGLTGLRYVTQLLLPVALPSVLAGLKHGWAFAWRTLIAAELVFGATSGQGGLGWYIFQNRNELYTDRVFAGLMLVILIGLAVERLVFQTLAALTVQRWGTQRAVEG